MIENELVNNEQLELEQNREKTFCEKINVYLDNEKSSIKSTTRATYFYSIRRFGKYMQWSLDFHSKDIIAFFESEEIPYHLRSQRSLVLLKDFARYLGRYYSWIKIKNVQDFFKNKIMPKNAFTEKIEQLISERFASYSEFYKNIIISLLTRFGKSVKWNVEFNADDLSKWIKAEDFDSHSSKSKSTYLIILSNFCEMIGKEFDSIKIAFELSTTTGIFTSILDKFLSTYCILEKNKMIRQKELYQAFESFCHREKYPIIHLTFFSRLLSNFNIQFVNATARSKSYIGISLNLKAIKEFGNETHYLKKKALKEINSLKNHDSKTIWKVYSSDVSITRLTQIVREYNQNRSPEQVRINLLKTRIILKDLEKWLFEQSRWMKTSKKIALSIMFANCIEMTKACKIAQASNSVMIRQRELRDKHPQFYKYVNRFKTKKT